MGFAYASRFRSGLPDPAKPGASLPPFNFSVGHNDPEHIPVDALADIAARAIRDQGSRLAIYNLGQSSLGHDELRGFVCRKLRESRGIEARPDDVLITSGSLQGIDLVNQLMLERGDHVILEEFTYGSVFARLKRLGVTWSGAALDAQGIMPHALASQLETLRGRGVVPKYLYTIPTIQNPTGSVMPLERRHRLIEVCRRYGVAIFEDECYTDVMWTGEAPQALYGIDPSAVIHIGSFSKSLAPALRVGYVLAAPDALARLLALKSDGGTAAIEQMLVAGYFESHFRDHLARLGDVLKRKRDVMIEALQENFGTSAEFARPDGGLFLWVKLPDAVDVRRFAAAAATEGVTFNVGCEWACDPERARSYMRLCFALPSEAQIREGIGRLARICFEHTGLPVHGSNKRR